MGEGEPILRQREPITTSRIPRNVGAPSGLSSKDADKTKTSPKRSSVPKGSINRGPGRFGDESKLPSLKFIPRPNRFRSQNDDLADLEPIPTSRIERIAASMLKVGSSHPSFRNSGAADIPSTSSALSFQESENLNAVLSGGLSQTEEFTTSYAPENRKGRNGSLGSRASQNLSSVGREFSKEIRDDLDPDENLDSRQSTMTSRWNGFRTTLTTKDPNMQLKSYIYVPPAAAKYFLWDNTPTGEPIICSKAYPAYTRCIVRNTARSALCRHLTKYPNILDDGNESDDEDMTERQDDADHQPQMNSRENMEPVGFFLCREVELSKGNHVDKNEKHEHDNDGCRHPVLNHDGKEQMAYGSFLVADRFDPGRRVDGELTPSFTMPTDVVVKVYASLTMAEARSGLYEAMFQSFDTRQPSTEARYPISIHCYFSEHELQSSQSIHSQSDSVHQLSAQMSRQSSIASMMLRHLVPDVKLEMTPIYPLLLVPTSLSTTLLVEGETPDVSFGYVTVDQSRHILPLLATDPNLEQLPLIGIWIKNAADAKSTIVKALCCQYISKSCKKLETGRSIMLLMLIPPNRKKALPSFYEVFYSESEYKFTVFGDSCAPPVPIPPSSLDVEDEESEDGQLELGFSYIYPLDEIAFCRALRRKYNIMLSYKPVFKPAPEPAPEDNKGFEDAVSNLDDRAEHSPNPEAGDESTKEGESTSPSDPPPEAAATANDMFQQQQKVYQELMEKQMEMWKSTLPAMLFAPPFPPHFGLSAASPFLGMMPPQASLYGNPTGYPFDPYQSLRAGLMAQSLQSPPKTFYPQQDHMRTSISSGIAGNTTEMRSVGTNTSIVFQTEPGIEKRNKTVDCAANTSFLSRDPTVASDSPLRSETAKPKSSSPAPREKPKPEQNEGIQLDLAPREPYTVATSCIADLEQSMERTSIRGGDRPPVDNGNNYQPFFTYEPLEDADLNIPRNAKDSFDFSKVVDISHAQDDGDWLRRGSNLPAGNPFDPLVDLSKIGNTSLLGKTFDSDFMAADAKEDHGPIGSILPNEIVAASDENALRERTLELIAGLVDNPEKTFIFIEDDGGGQQDLRDHSLTRGLVLPALQPSEEERADRPDRRSFHQCIQEHHLIDDPNESKANGLAEKYKDLATSSILGDSAMFTTQSDYSIGTLAYLKKYQLYGDTSVRKKR
ncbi:hypothetical protein HDU97_002274 [Phlyctochytrium planicorne]|nr:hypothetical protein HDU97_002274 [Phlyctochytrium planicorne]